MVNRVGVLALQGNYNQHKMMLDVLGIKNILVQYPRELENCDLLIIPGGESTAISKQIERNNFRHPILNFAKTNSVFGTCAGMILLSSSEKVTNLKPLSIMDFKVDRNAFGRQVDSFSGNLCLEFDKRGWGAGQNQQCGVTFSTTLHRAFRKFEIIDTTKTEIFLIKSFP